MLRIHGSARSRAQRTLWMTFELGIPFEHIDIWPRSPGTKTAEFLALNPNGRLPVIEDDGLVLYESMAINFYLAKKHNSPLYPSNPRDEALALQWSFWETDRLDRRNCRLVVVRAEAVSFVMMIRMATVVVVVVVPFEINIHTH